MKINLTEEDIKRALKALNNIVDYPTSAFIRNKKDFRKFKKYFSLNEVDLKFFFIPAVGIKVFENKYLKIGVMLLQMKSGKFKIINLNKKNERNRCSKRNTKLFKG